MHSNGHTLHSREGVIVLAMLALAFVIALGCLWYAALTGEFSERPGYPSDGWVEEEDQ